MHHCDTDIKRHKRDGRLREDETASVNVAQAISESTRPDEADKACHEAQGCPYAGVETDVLLERGKVDEVLALPKCRHTIERFIQITLQ